MTGISGALQIAAASALLGGYLLLVGAAVRTVVARWWAPVWPLGLTMAVGMAMSTVVLALAYRLFGKATAPVLPLGVLAAAVIMASVVRSMRARSGARDQDREGWTSLACRWVTPTDWTAAALATFVLLPLLRYGPTFWTSWVNDFVSYAASAQVWTGTSGAPGVDFATAHPDWFGTAMAARADHEKPMMTALLVLASIVSRLPSFQLLVPCMLVLLFVLASVVMRLVHVRFGLPWLTAAAVTALPFLSVVPLARVYDAQLGQVGSAALLGALLLVVVLRAPGSRGGAIAAGAVFGVLLAAAIGSNPTLVLGSAVAIAGIGWWLAAADRASIGARVRMMAAGLLVAAVLCVPFLAWFRASVLDQTSGVQGTDVPLLAPWAALGQQPTVGSTPGTSATLLWWGAVVLLLAIAAAVRGRRASGWSTQRTAAVVMVGCVLGNVAVVAGRVGWTNYSVHKITALLLLLAGPLALGLVVSWAPGRMARAVSPLLAVLVLLASVNAWNAAGTVAYVMPAELVALRDDPRLRDLDTLNLVITAHAEASFAALLVPSRSVLVTIDPFTPSYPDYEGDYLVRSADVPSDPGWLATPLNDLYSIVRFDQTVTEPVTAFTSAAPASRRHLFGTWYPAEGWGTWSGSATSTVVLRVPAALRSQDVELVVSGAPYADAGHPRTMTYVVDGATLATSTFTSPDQRAVSVRVPASMVAGSDGRLQLDIVNPAPLQPAGIGGGDTRLLAFALATVEVRAATAP